MTKPTNPTQQPKDTRTTADVISNPEIIKLGERVINLR